MVEVLSAGLLTTVQDGGRWQGAHMGIPSAGPMDRISAELANISLCNNQSAAVLECTIIGPTLKFHKSTCVSVTGAEVDVFINADLVSKRAVYRLEEGSTMSFGRIKEGCRYYIAFAGGVESEAFFHSLSASPSAGILGRMKKGDTFNTGLNANHDIPLIQVKRKMGCHSIKCWRGPEFELLNETQIAFLFSSSFEILSQSNRMAYCVRSFHELVHDHSIISSGTLPGTVQLTPQGALIFLMRDGQTTGGYPRVLQITEESICNLSQLMAGSELSLEMIGIQ